MKEVGKVFLVLFLSYQTKNYWNRTEEIIKEKQPEELLLKNKSKYIFYLPEWNKNSL